MRVPQVPYAAIDLRKPLPPITVWGTIQKMLLWSIIGIGILSTGGIGLLVWLMAGYTLWDKAKEN
jgi:hypothetical protein